MTKVFSLLAPNQIPVGNKDINAPGVSGWSFRFDWAKMQHTPGSFDFSLVEQALSLTAANQKECMLHLTAGSHSPHWAPAFISSGYLTAWQDFLEAFAGRYADHPLIWAIHMSGAGWSDETCMNDWVDEFTDDQLMAAWKILASTYVELFPNKRLYSPGVTPPMATTGGTGGQNLFAPYIIDNYRDRIGIYNHGLGGFNGQPNQVIQDAVRASEIGGFQAKCNYLLGWGWPTAGNPKTAFSRAKQNLATSVEIYQHDLNWHSAWFNDLVADLSREN